MRAQPEGARLTSKKTNNSNPKVELRNRLGRNWLTGAGVYQRQEGLLDGG